MAKQGIIICGHGSTSKAAVEEFQALHEKISKKFDVPVEYGFLEFSQPNLSDSLKKLTDEGVREIDATPGMLFAAGHVKNDVVTVLNDYKHNFNLNNPDDLLQVNFAKDLGIDPKLLKLSRARIEEAIDKADEKSGKPIKNEDSLLLVIGRGTSDPDANSNIAKVARFIAEGMGFGWHEVGYSGVTYPLVGPALEHCAKLPYKRIIVFPYFLFTGILVERIYSITDQMAATTPNIEFIKAEYLNHHDLVVQTFTERLSQINSNNDMNCLLCKYRDQIIGFEASVGEAQHGHHYHAQATSEDDVENGATNAHEHNHPDNHDDNSPNHDDNSHNHDDNSSNHGHEHTHPPHPFASHPHGPAKRDPDSL